MDPSTSVEMTEMQRRTFLRSMGLSAAFLLETAFPTSKPGLLGAEQLTHAADRLARLHVLDHQKGAAVVATEVAELAQRLLMQLKITPKADPLHRRLAMLTGEAAELACINAHHLGEAGPVASWARVAQACGQQAASPDLAAWGAIYVSDAFRLKDDPDSALAYLHRTPRDGLSAPVIIMLEGMRSLAAAQSSHPFPRRERWVRTAIERAQAAVGDLDANPSELPFVYWIGASHLSGLQGRAYELLGYGDAAYEVILDGLRDHHPEMVRGLGGKHTTLARASLRSGEVERACAHATEAHRILSETGSAKYLAELREFREIGLAPYADSAAVRQLDEQLGESRMTRAAATPETPAAAKRPRRRYVKTRSKDGSWKLHTAECPDGLRARKRLSYSPADGRRPDRLAENPALRPGVLPCERCIGPLWS